MRENASLERATLDDLEDLLSTLQAAYVGNPYLKWLLQRGDDAQGCREYFKMTLEFVLFPRGVVEKTHDARGVVSWIQSEQWHIPIQSQPELLASLDRLIGLEPAPHIHEGLVAIERLRPREPWIYLALIGTEPSSQRRGVGGMLLRRALETSRNAGLPLVVETSSRDSKAWFEGKGFSPVGHVALKEGPVHWCLIWR